MERPGLVEALADIRAVRRRVLDRQLFRGYSGWARIAGACFALLGACVLSRSSFSPPAAGGVENWPVVARHLAGWGAICFFAATLNAFALTRWMRRQSAEPAELRPVLDLVAPFIVGGFFTFALVRAGTYQLLMPAWMWLFGLMNISSRHCLPVAMPMLGCFYLAAGTVLMFSPAGQDFTNPWPMGLVFFLGELAGGLIFLRLRSEEPA